MHNIEKLGLQVFAAPSGMTGQAQIHVRAREIDFVTSFGKNIQALLDVMGITRMIKKDNGSVLKAKTVKGTLESLRRQRQMCIRDRFLREDMKQQ